MSDDASFVDALMNGYAAPVGDGRSWAISDRVARDPRSMIERRDSGRTPVRRAAPSAPSQRRATAEPVFRGPTPPMPDSWDAHPAIQTFMAAFPAEPAQVETAAPTSSSAPTAALLTGRSVPAGVEMPDGLPAGGGQGSPLLDGYLAIQGQRIRDAVTAPQRALSGDLQVFGADGHPTAEAMNAASGMAGFATTGGVPLAAAAMRRAAPDPIEAIRLGLAGHFNDPRYGLPPGRPGAEAAAAIEQVRAGLAKSTGDANYGLPPQGSQRAADDAIAALQAGVDRYLASNPPGGLADLGVAYMGRK